MSKKDSLNQEINIIEGRLRFLRNIILAILSGLVWSAFAILEKKVGNEIFLMSGLGFVALIFIFIRSKSLEIKQEELVKELRKEK